MHLSTHKTKLTGLHGQLNSFGRERAPNVGVNCIKIYYKAFPHCYNGGKRCQLAFGSKPLAKISFYPVTGLIHLSGAFAFCDGLRREMRRSEEEDEEF